MLHILRIWVQTLKYKETYFIICREYIAWSCKPTCVIKAGFLVHLSCVSVEDIIALQWRHNERDGVANHRRLGWLLNLLFRRRSKKTSKLRVTCLCEGNSLVTIGPPSQSHLHGKCLMTSSWQHKQHGEAMACIMWLAGRKMTVF